MGGGMGGDITSSVLLEKKKFFNNKEERNLLGSLLLEVSERVWHPTPPCLSNLWGVSGKVLILKGSTGSNVLDTLAHMAYTLFTAALALYRIESNH